MKIPEIIEASKEKNKEVVVLTDWKPDVLELKECMAAVVKADTYAGFTVDEKEAWREFIKDFDAAENKFIEGNYIYEKEIVDLCNPRCGNIWDSEDAMKEFYLDKVEKLKGLMYDINNERKKDGLPEMDWQQYFGGVSFFKGKYHVARDGDLKS